MDLDTNQNLQDEGRRLAQLFEKAPVFMAVVKGPSHVFELANDAYYQLIGHRDIIGKALDDALPDVRGQGFDKLLDRVLQTGEPFIGREIAVTVQRKPGAAPEERFVDFVYAPLTEPDGTRSGVIAYGSDVTDHVQARREIERLLAESETANEALQGQQVELELLNQQLQDNAVELEAQTEELQETAADLAMRTVEANLARDAVVASEIQLQTLADAIPTLAWTARPDGFIEWYNARWYEYTGTTPEQMTGWGWQSVHHPDTLPLVLEQWRGAIASGDFFEMTFPLRGGDGEFRRFLTRVVPLRDEKGEIIRWFGTNTDVELERRALDAAEAANRAKTDFLANMSHELRTPLNAIGGYADLLDLGIHGALTDQQREAVTRIRRSERHLLGLINEILNYAKLETGTVQFESARVDLHDTMASAESLVGPQAEAKGIFLTAASCTPSLDVMADAEKLLQIFVNLFSNAIKFTAAGGRVDVDCRKEEAVIHISVRDTGIGVPADKLEAIFNPFVQVRTDLTRPHEGTGLGLAISRELARAMEGELTVTSTLGEGSTFTLTLPLADDTLDSQ